jgi:ABC-type Fe3+-hydroxamate transport system substrate-binding protein
MGQRRGETLRTFFALTLASTLVAASCLGCERSAAVAPTTQASGPKTVASLVPAATDMIIAMGARDRLVAVSNWDAERPEIAGLPRVGDYRTIDWEKLASLRPDVMVVQWRPDKMPPGAAERAAELNIQFVNLRIVYLDEIFTAFQSLGDGIGEPEKATAAANELRRQLDAVRAAVAGRTPVRTLVSQTESPLSTVGGGNFMNDLLTLAGGKNVIEGGDNSYPNIDVERLVALNPDVVIHLLPGESPQVVERAKTFWSSHPELTAVKNGRVYLETDSYMLLPGPLVGKIAERFATLLHPGVTFPTTRPKDQALRPGLLRASRATAIASKTEEGDAR